MKITQIEAFALRYQKEKPAEQQTDNYYLPDEGWRCIYARHHETMVVRITTSDGIVGYGEGQSPEAAAARAAEYVAQGYGGLKIHATQDRSTILDIVAAVRERVGPQIKLMVDVHTQYSVPEATLLGRGLEALDVMWLESPTAPEDIPGQAALADALDMSVAIGEWTRTRFELREVFERRACDITMPDIARTGLTKGKRIVSLADTYNIPVTPHIGGGGILSIAATVQFSATIPNFLIMEHSPEAYEMKGQITTRKPTVKDGAFILDDTPGIGVTIDTEALEAFAINRQ